MIKILDSGYRKTARDRAGQLMSYPLKEFYHHQRHIVLLR
jgi:hypothetical protein